MEVWQYLARVFTFARICFSSVTNMPVFELQSCVWNYSELHAGIKNTNVVANNPPICENEDCYYFKSNNKYTLFIQRDKSNAVTSDFLDIISAWRSIRLTPAFSTPAFSVPALHTCRAARVHTHHTCTYMQHAIVVLEKKVYAALIISFRTYYYRFTVAK